MTNTISEWGVLKTWASQTNKELFLNVSEDAKHSVRITSSNRSWFGRVWMVIQSLFGSTSLENVAQRAITLAEETKPLKEENRKVIEKLREKVEHFNSRWYHFKKISPAIFKSLLELIDQNKAKDEESERLPTEEKPSAPGEKPNEAEKPSKPTHKPHKKPLTGGKRPAHKPIKKNHPEPKKTATKPSLPPAQPLSDLSAQELAIIKKHSAEDVPLVGPLYTPLSVIYSHMYEPGARDTEQAKARKAQIKAGIDFIEKEFTMCRIKGDGHCMFRAITVSLLDRFKNDPKALLSLVRRALSLVEAGAYKLPEPDLRKIEQSINLLNPGLIHTITLDDPTMTSWVVFLRRLAASNILSQPSEASRYMNTMLDDLNDQALTAEYIAHQSELEALQRSDDVSKAVEINHAAEACQQKILQRYFATKTDMSGKDPLKTYGTQLELMSLVQALHLDIVPINFTHSVTKRLFAYTSFPSGNFLFAEQAPKTDGIFLIFQDNHYSSLFPK